MAALFSSADGLARSSPSSRQSTAPAPVKLRDSCHACASSKVKCHKEKPTCSRCAKRGLTCEYFVTKRAGRKHESRSTDNSNKTFSTTEKNAPQVGPSSNWSTNPSSSSGTFYLTTPDLVQPSPRTNEMTTDSSDIFPDLLTPIEHSMSSTFTNLTTEFDDFFALPISFPAPDTSDSDIVDQPQNHKGASSSIKSGFDSNNATALFIPEDTSSLFDGAVSELSNFSEPRSPPNSRASLTSDVPNYQDFHTPDSPCSCLIRALGLMKQLFPSVSTDCTMSNVQDENNANPLPTIQTVIAENKQTIETISTMLQCRCSQDGYLLAIMSLIVFKVLGWYAAAARETPAIEDDGHSSTSSPYSRSSSVHSEQVLQYPTVVDSYCLEGEDLGRIAGQLVLSELHRVQRLVNQLSQKLKTYGTQNRAVGLRNSPGESDGSCLDDGLSLDGKTTLPFSAKMLEHLDADLRKRLSSLSLEIIDMLRRE